MNLFLLKLFLIPTLTYFVSWAQKRYSGFIGGALTGLPLVAGPITAFIGYEQGIDFAKISAQSSLSGLIAASIFSLSFLWIGARYKWWHALIGSTLLWWSLIITISFITISAKIAIALGFCAALLNFIPFLYPKTEPLKPFIHIRYEALIRAFCTLIPLLLITTYAENLGAHLSGLLAVYPIMFSIIYSFTLAKNGYDQLRSFFSGIAFGQISFVSFLGCAAYLPINHYGLWLSAIIGITLLIAALVFFLKRRHTIRIHIKQG